LIDLHAGVAIITYSR